MQYGLLRPSQKVKINDAGINPMVSPAFLTFITTALII
jgi:hypothetical protein